MKNIYILIRNFLLFYFLEEIFNGISISQGLLGKLFIAFIFGFVMMIVPNMLTFFKISVNAGSMFLMSLVLAFLFFFLLSNGLFGVARITSSSINLGLDGSPSLNLDQTGTLMLVSIVSALLSVWLDKISGIKRK